MQQQLALPLPPETKPAADDVARLTSHLYALGDTWTSASSLSRSLGYSDRHIRALASASHGMILSGPGCPGYKHIRHSDPEEVSAVTARLEHQARLMSLRAGTLRRAWHAAAAPRQ